MKIVIICNCATGLERFRGMLIQALVEKGNDVNIIVPKSEEIKELNAEKRIEKMHCQLKKVEMERRGMNPFVDLKMLMIYYGILKKIAPDLVITYTIKPNIYGGFASRLLKIPYVVNITGLGTAFQKNGMLHRIVTMMYKVALKRAKIVFFENTENRDIIVEEKIITEQKTHILAGAGVDLEYFQYLEYPEDNKEIHFLFIGRIMQEKGIGELFSVMRRLRKNGYHCDLNVLGGLEENYSDSIRMYEKEGWLYYRGYHEDIRPFIQKCHCFVLPSWHEGMANTNLESAASGRPIITTDIYGCKEAILDGVSGYLVRKKDEEDLYKKMKKFIELSNQEKKQMGIIGRQYMQQNFDKKRVVQETLQYMGV